MLMSALVTRDNAKVLLMQGEELMRQTNRLNLLHNKVDTYLHELDTQRVINLLAVGIIVLFIVVFVLFYLYHLRKIRMQRERVANTLWNMEKTEYENVGSTVNKSDSRQPQNVKAPESSMFITRFREAVEARLDDSNLSIDDLASDMNISRVQLYRKVKSITGSSPVELLRTARLNRAYQLLITTDKSVSEVAYTVGFTAPSYFTKCFKEEYGFVPGDVKKVH
jgi:AraC-like DNA-binding protein